MQAEEHAKIGEDWTKIVKLLPEGWESQARTTGALKFGRQFTGPDNLLRVLLMYFSDGCSMRETVARARAGNLAEVSDVSLLKRVNKSGEWLRWMSERLIQESPIPIMTSSALLGRRILAVDGSVIREPGAITSTWRVHYAMDISTLGCQQVEVTRGKVGESLTRFAVQKRDVILADRGFANRRGVNHVLDHGGDVLVRMNLASLPLTDAQGNPFVQLAHLRTLQSGKMGEWPAILQGTKGPVAVRVCAYRKNEAQRIESERKYHQYLNKKQQKFNAETLEATEYVVVVTSLEELDAEGILALYRHRWQIELAFKRMKSLLGLGYLKKKDTEGAKAWLQGKLFVACLIERLIALGDHFSPVEPTQYETESRSAPLSVA
jgi:Transposase DDE domain